MILKFPEIILDYIENLNVMLNCCYDNGEIIT
jgi:hypothetical protein